MTFQLDHIVVAVNDLEKTISDYASLGFNVLRGGDHPGRATHNALVVFADGSYFELIAWKAPAPEERWWQLLQRHGEGVVDFALLPRSTAEAVAAAARRGLVLDGPLDGGRLRPDGERLHWQIARPPSPDLPFLCGDLTPRALRVPEGDARVHPNGVTGIASLAIAVRDLDASLSRYRALFGPADDSVDTHVGRAVHLPGAQSRVALVAIGESTLVLSSPRTPHRDAHAALESRLAAFGEGPFSIVLRTSDTPDNTVLDLARTHGASIELEPSHDLAGARAPEAATI